MTLLLYGAMANEISSQASDSLYADGRLVRKGDISRPPRIQPLDSS